MSDVYIHCRTLLFPAGNPVDGVLVSIHPSGGGAALASGTTGAPPNVAGSVFLGDRAAGDYEIHVTPPLGAATVPDGSLQTITVTPVVPPAPDPDQIFDVLIDVSALPNATDIHFCRCSGTFMDPQGKPVKQLTINISENTIPELAYYAATNTANAIIPKTQIIRTDSAGHASVDLLRGATYQVYMEGFENLSRSIKVPDLAASSLPDVIFPVVDGVEYTVNDVLLLPVDQPVLNLGVGQQAVLSLETVHRSGLRVDGLVAVTLTSDDVGGQFITLSYLDSNTLEVTAVAAGNPLLEVARIAPEEGMGISTVPEPVLRGTLSVVVT